MICGGCPFPLRFGSRSAALFNRVAAKGALVRGQYSTPIQLLQWHLTQDCKVQRSRPHCMPYLRPLPRLLCCNHGRLSRVIKLPVLVCEESLDNYTRIAKLFTWSCSRSVRCKLLHCDALHRGFPGCYMDRIESVQAMPSMPLVQREIR